MSDDKAPQFQVRPELNEKHDCMSCGSPFATAWSTTDGKAWLLVNSHQPTEGRFAWYEAHIKSDEGGWRKGGMTVAFKKSNRYPRGRMVEVAVAVCSPDDTFSRKIGTKLALEKFFCEQVIELPLLEFYPPEDINQAVKQAFSNMWNSI